MAARHRGWPGCPDCRAPLPPKARFCPRCGAALAGRALAEARPSGTVRVRRTFTSAWALFRPVLTFYLCLLGLFVVTTLAGRGRSQPAAMLVGTLAMGGLVGAFAWRDRGDVGPLLSRSGLRGPAALLVPGLLVALVLAAWGYGRALVWVGFEAEDDMIGVFRDAGWPTWSGVALLTVAPGVIEEIGLRGFVQSRLMRVAGPREALVVQAALFSILHLNPAILPTHFLIGLALGWLRLVIGSLYPGMLLHASYNAVFVALDLAGRLP